MRDHPGWLKEVSREDPLLPGRSKSKVTSSPSTQAFHVPQPVSRNKTFGQHVIGLVFFKAGAALEQ